MYENDLKSVYEEAAVKYVIRKALFGKWQFAPSNCTPLFIWEGRIS